MIETIIELRSVGLLHDALPKGALALSKAVAVYAENGRGKSTLACLLRSLCDGDCAEVQARRTLGDEAEPSAQLLVGGAKHTLSRGSWDKVHQGVHVFGDDFVEKNVCLGTHSLPPQRANLLAFVLGAAAAQPAEETADDLEEYRHAVNARLRLLGAGFEIATLKRSDGDDDAPQADYTLRLMGLEVPLDEAEPSSPSFSTALSRGDRRLLALSLYLARLDLEPGLPGDTLVLDEPASGFDERRKTRLAEALMEFIERGVQVVVLSHDARFVRMLRDQGFDTVLQLGRSGAHCVVEECAIDAVCAMDYVDRSPQPHVY